MQKKTKGWSSERRARQAQICRQTKPERYATGPRTQAGKIISSQNARKHGLRAAETLKLRKLLRRQKTLINTLISSPLPSPTGITHIKENVIARSKTTK